MVGRGSSLEDEVTIELTGSLELELVELVREEIGVELFRVEDVITCTVDVDIVITVIKLVVLEDVEDEVENVTVDDE